MGPFVTIRVTWPDVLRRDLNAIEKPTNDESSSTSSSSRAGSLFSHESNPSILPAPVDVTVTEESEPTVIDLTDDYVEEIQLDEGEEPANEETGTFTNPFAIFGRATRLLSPFAN